MGNKTNVSGDNTWPKGKKVKLIEKGEEEGRVGWTYRIEKHADESRQGSCHTSCEVLQIVSFV